MDLAAAERLAAYLIAPDAAPPPEEPIRDAEGLVAFAAAQKLPLAEVIRANRLQDDPRVRSEALRPVLEADRARERRITAEYKALQVRLIASGIDHVLIKGVHGVPYRSDNIDILIPGDGLPRTRAFLKELGYIHFTNYTDRSKELHKLIQGSRLAGMFHLHRRVAWYSHFVEPEIIFAGARDGEEPGVRIPDPEVSLCINGCHALYEDASVKFIEFYKIRHAVKHGPVDWDRVWQIAGHRGFTSGLALVLLILDRQNRTYTGRPLFDDAQLARMESHLSRVDGTRGHYRRRVRGRDLRCPYVMSKYFVRRCLFRQLKRARIMPLRTKARLTGRILWHGVKQVTGWRPQPLRVVAMCGTDGCGKTTQVDRLARLLGDLEFPSVASWVRIGDSPLLNWMKGPFRQRLRAEVSTGQASEQGVIRNPVLRRLWPPVAVADYLLRQYVAIGLAWIRGRVLIADRYHVDAMVDIAMRCGPSLLKRHWLRAAMRLLPRARPTVVLEVSDEAARCRRKGEYVHGVSHRAHGLYRGAAAGFDVCILSGEDDPDRLTETIAKEFLRLHLNPR